MKWRVVNYPNKDEFPMLPGPSTVPEPNLLHADAADAADADADLYHAASSQHGYDHPDEG